MPFDMCQKFENFSNSIYDKRKVLFKLSNESLYYLLEDEIVTGKIHFNIKFSLLNIK